MRLLRVLAVLILVSVTIVIDVAQASATNDIADIIAKKSGSPVSVSSPIKSVPADGDLSVRWNNFNNQYALVVFFSSTCPHCLRFTPIIADFAAQHNIKTYAYTIDGNGNTAFPNPLTASDEVKAKFYQSMQVVVPAVFIVNTNTMEITPIDVGEESATDFSRDMDQFAKNLKE